MNTIVTGFTALEQHISPKGNLPTIEKANLQLSENRTIIFSSLVATVFLLYKIVYL
jgi:hypothetical protein